MKNNQIRERLNQINRELLSSRRDQRASKLLIERTKLKQELRQTSMNLLIAE